ncbi:MAG: DNA internalization-related competence protein ComEC/Rec2 [Rubrivivax sp.]|nr:DNA internalization-related competence protein ComEC/Rec2 [Rubrivivax sp.]
MERVLAWTLAWLLGVGLQLQQATLQPGGLQAGLVGAGGLLLAALVLRRGLRRAWVTALGALALAAIAFGSTDWRAAQRLAEALPAALEGQDLQVVGVVASLPQRSAAGTRFVFEVESAERLGQAVTVPRRLSLGWWYGDEDAAGAGAAPGPEALRAGQRWRFTVRLRQPHGQINPHGFDAELWLFEQGLRASGSVRTRARNEARRLDDAAGFPVQRARQAIRDRLEATVPDAEAAGLLAALAIGDQGAIDRAGWEVFRVTGVAHLVSISGLHVTLFAWLASALVGWGWRRAGSLPLRLPAPIAARWGGLALAAGYALLAGWGVPAQRTVLMLAIVVLLRSAGRHWPGPLVLLAAAVAVALADPWALLQPGFWLSFVAVALLMVSDPVPSLPPAAAEGRGVGRRAGQALRRALHTQAVATVGLAPLSLLFFQQLSLVGFVANLVAIPWVTLLLMPLSLLGVLLPPLWSLDALLATALLRWLGWLASLPWAQWTVPVAPPWAALLGLLGGLVLVLPLPWRLRLLGLPLLLPLLAPLPERPPPGRFELLALDVGQGTAVLVRTQQHLLVYDTGPQYGVDADAGERVLLPLLRARGERAVDLLLLSHRDADHVGGAASLLRRMPVRPLGSSLPDDHPLRAWPLPQQRCHAGQRWQWDGVDFEMLHPDDEDGRAPRKPSRSNAQSCVLRVQAAQGSALLTGDIERAQELALVDRLGTKLRADVLLVPHHGSRTSSSGNFLAAVAPRVALVQAAYRSRFGHPAPDVVARYATHGIALLRSDRCGAWSWRADGSMHCQRELDARYWHHRAAASDGAAGAPERADASRADAASAAAR